MTALRSYLAGTGAHVAARGVDAASAFATVWIATRLTSASEYGALLLALTVVSLLHLLVTGAIERMVIYRVARATSGAEAGLAAASVRLALAATLAVALLLLACGPALGRAFGDPSVEAWLALVAFRLPAAALPTVHAAWLRGRQRVAESIWHGHTVPGLLTVAGLAGAWVLDAGRTGLGCALVAGPLLAGGLSVWRHPLPLRRPGVRLRRADLSYGAKLGASAVVHRGVGSTDILLLGVLATSLETAQYGVAARLAALALVAHEALGGVLGPRMGRLLVRGPRAALAAEYDRVRNVALCGALAVLALMLLAGDRLLALFGPEYAAAWPVLVVLTAAYVVPVAFGSNGALLNMAGHGGWSLAASSLVLAANVGLGLWWIPLFGGLGAAAATGVALLGENAMITAVATRLEHLPTLTARAAGAAFGAVLGAGVAAAGLLAGPWAAPIPLAVLLLVALRSARAARGERALARTPLPVREGP